MKSKKNTSLFSRRFLQSVVLSAIFSCLFLSASAVTNTWVGPATGGDWSNAANWSSTAVPVAADSVLIASPNAVTISTAVGTINKLAVQGSLTITASGSLTISQAVKSTSLLEIGGGVVSNAGSLTLTQNLANGIPGLSFVNGTAADGTLTNTGTLTINTAFTGATGDCVSFKQTTGGTATLNLGGTMTFTPAATKNIFDVLGGNAQIAGSLTVTSSNSRLINIVAGNIKLGSSTSKNGNIEFTGSTATAIISMGNTATAPSTSTLTNYGTLKLHTGSSFTSNAIQISPGTGVLGTSTNTSTFDNFGTVIIDGTTSSSTGLISFGGSTDASSVAVLTNESNASFSAINTGAYAAVVATNTKTNIVNNYGTMTFGSGGTTNVRCLQFGGTYATFNNNSGGIVTVKTGITGSSSNTNPCKFYNNSGAIFNFDLTASNPLNATNDVAIHNAALITFTNSGGTVTGRGVFATNKFVPSTGSISPGNSTNPIGIIQINGTPIDFSASKFIFDVNGITTGGTDFDKITYGTTSAAITMTGATFSLNIGSSYTPTNNDQITLFSNAGTAGTITGTPSCSTANWVTSLNTITNPNSIVMATYYAPAAVPNAATVNNPSASTLDVLIDVNGNPTTTQFAIQETGSSNYVQADGSLAATAVWQTAATWATKTVTGLSANTSYTFHVKARNAANTETTFGATATLATTLGTGVEKLKSSSAISLVDGNIQFTASANQTIEIYNAVGQRLLSKTSVEGMNSIVVTARGLVILKVGNSTQKIVL